MYHNWMHAHLLKQNDIFGKVHLDGGIRHRITTILNDDHGIIKSLNIGQSLAECPNPCFITYVFITCNHWCHYDTRIGIWKKMRLHSKDAEPSVFLICLIEDKARASLCERFTLDV